MIKKLEPESIWHFCLENETTDCQNNQELKEGDN